MIRRSWFQKFRQSLNYIEKVEELSLLLLVFFFFLEIKNCLEKSSNLSILHNRS